jgi:hypothetical protein
MAPWTKQAAIVRMTNNPLLEEVLRIESRLRPIIEEAKSQRKTIGYNRIRRYIELRNRVIPLVGDLAENGLLRKRECYDVVRDTIDDLLPPDEVDIYPDGGPQHRSRTPRNTVERERSEREKMSRSLRLSILERDNFTCKYCGASPRNDDKVRLQVDHIVPVAKGGKTEPQNLHTLCADCNLGKGTRIIDQMRSS